jgi:putative transposase
MKYNPEKHHRRSIRLKDYDYSQAGAYYVTICCNQRRFLLGEIINGVMQLNLIGQTVEASWNSLPRHFSFIELDAFIVMPNHVHGIIVITENCRGEAFGQTINETNKKSLNPNASPSTDANQPIIPCGTKSGSLGAIIQNFKSVATRRVNSLTRNKGTIWQRDYYEEIIRDEKAYENLRRYILENPLKWNEDEENPFNSLQV